MEGKISSAHRSPNARRSGIWGGCLPELPLCAFAGCERHAVEVDPYFPYLDDRNRCDFHSLDVSHASSPRPARPHPAYSN